MTDSKVVMEYNGSHRQDQRLLETALEIDNVSEMSGISSLLTSSQDEEVTNSLRRDMPVEVISEIENTWSVQNYNIPGKDAGFQSEMSTVPTNLMYHNQPVAGKELGYRNVSPVAGKDLGYHNVLPVAGKDLGYQNVLNVAGKDLNYKNVAPVAGTDLSYRNVSAVPGKNFIYKNVAPVARTDLIYQNVSAAPGKNFNYKNVAPVAATDLSYQTMVSVPNKMHDEVDRKVCLLDLTNSSANCAKFDLDGVIEPTQWPGLYGFKVSVDYISSKKAIFDCKNNKLFCLNGFPVSFRFKCDTIFNNIEGCSIFATVAFEEPQFIECPVLRCSNHVNIQLKTQGTDHPDAKANSMIFVQGKNTFYYQSRVTRRCYAGFPMEIPKCGQDSCCRGIVFSCLHSCKSADGGGVRRRPLRLIFALLDKEDYEKDNRENVEIDRFVKKRKLNEAASTVSEATTELPVIIKRNSGNNELQEQDGLRPESSNSGASSHYLDLEKDNDAQSSSQEIYSDHDTDNRLRMKSLYRDCKSCIRHMRSKDPHLHELARNLFACLKTAKGICNSIKMAETPGMLPNEDENDP